MDSIAQQIEQWTSIPKVRVQIPLEWTFFSWLRQCQIIMEIFCSYTLKNVRVFMHMRGLHCTEPRGCSRQPRCSTMTWKMSRFSHQCYNHQLEGLNNNANNSYLMIHPQFIVWTGLNSLLCWLVFGSVITTYHILMNEYLRPCLHEEKLPLVGELPWPPSQLLAGVYMGKKKVAPLIWFWGNWEKLLFPCWTFP